jgi:hypothetical protein
LTGGNKPAPVEIPNVFPAPGLFNRQSRGLLMPAGSNIDGHPITTVFVGMGLITERRIILLWLHHASAA